MNHCRECGRELLRRSISPEQEYIAQRNIEHFSKALAEEGHLMPMDQERKMRRILYESQLALRGEMPFDNALCDTCRSK